MTQRENKLLNSAEGYTGGDERMSNFKLEPTDYLQAASILASCQRGRIPAIVTLLERSGLDMSGVRGAIGQPALDPEEAQQITEFVGREVPAGWTAWSLADRRAYWAGEIPCDTTQPRDRISAMEVWCELYGKPSEELTRHRATQINSVLQTIPGWRKTTVRIACYGAVKGFVNDNY